MNHPFETRSGLGEGGLRAAGHSFLLFLDSVWQLTMQYPAAFEFSETFLIRLFDHSQSSQCGKCCIRAEGVVV